MVKRKKTENEYAEEIRSLKLKRKIEDILFWITMIVFAIAIIYLFWTGRAWK